MKSGTGEERYCRKCKKFKPISDFRTGEYGAEYTTHCDDCFRKVAKKNGERYYKRNKEACKKSMYRENAKTYLAQHMAIHRHEIPEELIQYKMLQMELRRKILKT